MEGKRSVSKSQLALEEGVTSKTPGKIPFLLAGIFVATTVALLITTIVFALQKNHIANMLEQLMKGTSKPHEPGPRPICTTKQCYDSAYLYLSNMDQTKAPCDNFFDYACGGWTKRYTVPEDQTRFSTLTKLREGVADRLRVLFERSPTLGEPDSYHIVRNDYKSCEDMDTINNLGVKPLTDLLTSLGGWPVVGDNPAGGNWNPAAFDFEKLWADIRGKYGVQMFVATGTWPDPDNAAKYKLDAYVPDFVVPKFDIEKRHWPGVHPMLDGTDDAGYDGTMLFDDKYSSERKAYLQYLIDIAVALGANETVAMQDMTDLIEFESTMANLTVIHPDFDRVITTLEEIGMNLIDWVRLYQLMLPGSVDPGVTGDEPIVNYNPNYISNVTVWLRDQDNRVKANYMIWRLVSRMVPFMGETFLVIRRKFLQSVNGTVATTARWKTCASNVNDQYKFISGRMYVDEHFPEDTKRKALNMFRTLQQAFSSLLATNGWLQKEDKSATAEKVDAMTVEIGYPEWIKHNTNLDAEYANLTAEEDEYFKNSLRYREWTSRRELALLRKNVENSLWSFAGPADVNAYYSYTRNGVLLPAGILQPPLYHKDLPWYSNYGGIGVVLGHEIMHGFNNIGRRYDKDGNYRTWWTQRSSDSFKEESQCIIDQYSDFVMPENNRSLNGQKTQSENIADNGGLRVSYEAYTDKMPEGPRLPGIDFTQEQMFFLSFSQIYCTVFTPKGADVYIDTNVHSPGRYRAIGSLQNNEAFNAAFSCPAGSYMNPDVKCRVW